MTGEITVRLPHIVLEVFDERKKVDEKYFDAVWEAYDYANENGITIL